MLAAVDSPDTSVHAALGAAHRALPGVGSEGPADELLDRYAEAAGRIGEQDVAAVPTGSVAEAVRFVVVNTVLLEPVLLALRRLAQEDASRRRFPDDC